MNCCLKTCVARRFDVGRSPGPEFNSHQLMSSTGPQNAEVRNFRSTGWLNAPPKPHESPIQVWPFSPRSHRDVGTTLEQYMENSSSMVRCGAHCGIVILTRATNANADGNRPPVATSLRATFPIATSFGSAFTTLAGTVLATSSQELLSGLLLSPPPPPPLPTL